MSKLRTNVMRAMRLQLKTGFLKEEPHAYKFMKKYPPLTRDTKPQFHEFKRSSIPYLDLYEKAVSRNPMYHDEKVYPAYWAQEPQALTVAKKQYEYIQQGLDEEAAYGKAIEYIDEVENKSYLKLKSMLAEFEAKGAKKSIFSDAKILSRMAKYQSLLENTSYDELPDADQGEIDFFIQTKILRWSELERERHMKDPIFVMEFVKLRAKLFPDADSAVIKQKHLERENFKKGFYVLHSIDPKLMGAAEPFFMEDYISFFEKVKSQPDIKRWSYSDREALQQWALATLAARNIVDRQLKVQNQRYVSDLIAHFFPMIRNHERAASLPTPTVDQLKSLLFSNDVGYKRDSVSGKVFVRRFYRIPKLLFPNESLEAAPPTEEERLRLNFTDKQDGDLLQDMAAVGTDEVSLPDIKKQLNQYLAGSKLGPPNYSNGPATSSSPQQSESLDLSVLDGLLQNIANSRQETGPDGQTNKTTGRGNQRYVGGTSANNNDGGVSIDAASSSAALLANELIELPPSVRDELAKYIAGARRQQVSRSRSGNQGDEGMLDLAVLDELLNSISAGRDPSAAAKSTSKLPSEVADADKDKTIINLPPLPKSIDKTDDSDETSSSTSSSSSDSSSDADSIDHDDRDNHRIGDRKHEAEADRLFRLKEQNKKSKLSPEAWEKLVRRYKKDTTGNELETQRDQLYSIGEHGYFDTVQNEVDLEAFKTARLENEIIARARLGSEYERKESARRVREWNARGVMSLPAPPLNLFNKSRGDTY